ncbi:hypothetical protein [Aestuariibacter sp. A3R04]|uniref:hypothetical protein n=1 Tax=Aestuariibacter sp. A3R04 TaxID=2841571 RepID=UPI001C091579|nr:hypothetical protein [Aestuariibacter sp. A3R04]MBU3020499.1 hypothetical protein [Aestuariibacter sp. A3R04]
MVAKWCKGAALITALCLGACSEDSSSSCEQYPEVCAELENHAPVNVIVTLALGADEEGFVQWLEDENIAILASFDATGQMLLEVNRAEFDALSQHHDIEKIQKDKFYPR